MKYVEDLKQLQENFDKDFKMSVYENWFYNQATGLLSFSTGDNEINFRYVDIVSFSENSNAWKRSWDHEHTLDNVKSKAELIREFGRNNNFSKLTAGFFHSNEVE